MPKIKIVIGGRDSGKTKYCNQYRNGKNSLMIEGRYLDVKYPFAFSRMDSNTELLIIDDVKIENLNRLVAFLLCGKIEVHRIRSLSESITLPETIITCCTENYSLPVDLMETSRFEVIHISNINSVLS